ncbi:MAG: hypothetical protein ACREBJ_05890 [Nitrosotalea sp.]
MFTANTSKVFDKTLFIVHNLGFKKEKENRAAGQIIVSSGVSLFSWGEKILIDIIHEGGKTKVTVSSLAKAQLFDWGKNSENEKKIINELIKILQ